MYRKDAFHMQLGEKEGVGAGINNAFVNEPKRCAHHRNACFVFGHPNRAGAGADVRQATLVVFGIPFGHIG